MLDIHLSQEDERRFKCDECGRGYRHAGSLTNHKKTHDVGSFQCNICGKENSNALALKSHLRSHTSQKKYQCLECGKAFRRASQLVTHERVHVSKQVQEHSFREDDMEYVICGDQNKIQNGHMDFFPLAGISTENSTCDNNTDVVYNTQTETSDSLDRPFKCDLCDKSYIHHRSLSNHKKTHQTGMFECTMCFKLFNNMAALYNHQRTHKSKSQVDSLCGSYTATTLDQLSPQSQNTPVNFCHLCQVLFSNEEEFQEHIQMHNSSPAFGFQDALSQNALYNNSTASPESALCLSPVNTIRLDSVSTADNSGSFDLPYKQTTNNGLVCDSPNHEIASANNSQEELSIMDSNFIVHQNANYDKIPAVDLDERPFKCDICLKTYRHSGSLINHKRSHQVGNYHCSICGKKCPHLAALKSHLRIHKTQPTSFNPRRGNWHSSEPLTMEDQLQSFSQDNMQTFVAIKQENSIAHINKALFNEHQEFSSDGPHNHHQRHMCTDCGQTFEDFAGIKSHSCLSLKHNTTSNHLESSKEYLQNSVENPSCSLDFSGLNSHHIEFYFERTCPENVSNDPLNSRGADEEEDDTGDFYQCSVCGINYRSMTALKSHLQGHTQSHSDPASSSPSTMSSQEEVKDEELGEMMICCLCGKSFSNCQDLVSHQLQHGKDQLDKVKDTNSKCEVKDENLISSCGTSYSPNENHACMVDTNQSTTKTEDKIKGTSNNRETGVVKEVVNTVERRYRCEQCGRSYRHAGSLLNHKKSHKTGLFRCHVCQKRFNNLLALKNHQRSHFDVKRYTCHECGKAFKIHKQLLNHLRRHKGNPAETHDLNNQALVEIKGSRSDGGMQSLSPNQAFAKTLDKTQKDLKESKATIHSEDSRDKRPFACDLCGRTYRHAGSLVNHKNSHKMGEYHCSICNNTYSNQLAMKNHLRTHFAFKRHSCQKCGKRFRAKKQHLVHVCRNLKKGSQGWRGLRSRQLTCKKCSHAFTSLEQIAAHKCAGLTDNSDQTNVFPIKEERPFTCNICNRTYRHAGSLLNHKNTHKTGHYNCTFCSKHFTNPMALRNHTRIHTQKKSYVCLTCGKAFRLASILYNHQKVHNRVAGQFSCPDCEKSFQSRSGLKRHCCRRGQEGTGQDQHSDRGDKCFMCDLCGRSYRHAGSLLNHKKTHSESLHQCTLCLQTFPDLLALHEHSQMKRHYCPECGKTFCLVSHLQSHMEVHAKDQDPSQPGVENGLYWDSNQNINMNITLKQEPPPLSHILQKVDDAEDKSHVCEHCGRTYRHAGSLLNHKNSHKTGNFFCAVCQKAFTNLMALKNHRRIHTEPKRYQCLECGKAFRVSTQLMCHRRIHTREKPFACPLCDKSFSSKSNLRHHEKMHQNSNQTDDQSFTIDGNAFMDLDMSAFL